MLVRGAVGESKAKQGICRTTHTHTHKKKGCMGNTYKKQGVSFIHSRKNVLLDKQETVVHVRTAAGKSKKEGSSAITSLVKCPPAPIHKKKSRNRDKEEGANQITQHTQTHRHTKSSPPAFPLPQQKKIIKGN